MSPEAVLKSHRSGGQPLFVLAFFQSQSRFVLLALDAPKIDMAILASSEHSGVQYREYLDTGAMYRLCMWLPVARDEVELYIING
jgi:hypothetical protein